MSFLSLSRSLFVPLVARNSTQILAGSNLQSHRWSTTINPTESLSPVFGTEMPKKVTICEVGCRDGLQNEKVVLPTRVKLELLDRLKGTGLTYMEATSFVSGRWVPQMADSKEIMNGLPKDDGVMYSVLVPNLKGFQNAMSCNAKAIAFFTAASETFCKKNMNCSIDDSFKSFESCLPDLPSDVYVRGYLSCVLGCPFENDIPPQKVAEVAARLLDMGCHEISLGDTIGRGSAGQTAKMLEEVMKVVPVEKIAVHFHDTYGQALTNILTSLQMGVSIIDSSVAGLGGCPYAPAASGNVASEDVIYMLNGLGIETGVDLVGLMQTGEWISSLLGRPTSSKVSLALNPGHGQDYGTCVRNVITRDDRVQGMKAYNIRELK
eukprot:CAMPEP_0201512504 /NCGR_PEP_ID=MMETSP0161_2-20130828/4747_1 /ASSEMBLY_ACC=CAM_ASM_000251 /TAXON_ID=180227 /ORGANISM="Neoparamoeba aestuarina, Strain SoJaBio B1-5/56/2" /LENGTH=377 /DNA_ID=CAMNT_0047908377 /DNA_START=99 /DNA_END=1232 /DNA_ORIENTATION=-